MSIFGGDSLVFKGTSVFYQHYNKNNITAERKTNVLFNKISGLYISFSKKHDYQLVLNQEINAKTQDVQSTHHHIHLKIAKTQDVQSTHHHLHLKITYVVCG